MLSARGGTATVLAMAVVMAGAMATISGCKATCERCEEDDVVVSIEELPPEVRRTIEANLNGGSVRTIELSDDDGKRTYDVEVDGANGRFEFEVAPDGTFLGMDEEDEDEERAD